MSAGALAIGVCTRNRGEAITRTLDAIGALDDVGGRVSRCVVIDNASTDDSRRIAEAWVDHRRGGVRFEVRHEPRPGKVNALRALFLGVDEPLVGVLDDDTLPDPGWARAMLSLADQTPRAGAIGGPVHNVWETGPTRLARIYRRSLGDQLLGDARVRLGGASEFLMGASMVYRASAVRESGWLDEARLECSRGARLDCGEDAELCILIRRAGWDVWYEPGARCGHQIPAWRQTPEYLARLRESICRSEPVIQWLARGSPTDAEAARWARGQGARARLLAIKSMVFDWRPTRRRVRIAERLGRARGWSALADQLSGATAVSPSPEAP